MGVFQIYVNLALTFKLFFVRDRTDYLKIIVFVVTILTTFSTPGIFHLTLILIAFAADSMNKKHINRLIKTATVLFFIMAIVVLINQQVLTLVESSINKLVTQGTSYQIRLASIIGNLKAWIEKPFFGHGIDNGIQRALDLHLRQFSMHNTSTTTSFLAIYGFPFVIVVTAPMLLLFRKIDSKTISKCLLLVGLFTSIESQRLIYDQFLYVLYFSYFMRQKTLRIDDGLDKVSGSRKEMSNV
ncbi:MAG: hypothetical protein GX957_02135 [Clostridiaceae bacterium]|nr:hypothetical protein [Clostridiaceae bacterium]